MQKLCGSSAVGSSLVIYFRMSKVEDLKPVWVMGHKNPDTDAICAAVGYAAFLRATGREEAQAARCGAINERTEWVLKEAGIAAPKMMIDVRPTARAVARKDVITARGGDTFLEVYQQMSEAGVRSLPVVDEGGTVVGMPTFMELLELLMPDVSGSGAGIREIRASLADVARALKSEVDAPDGCDGEEDLVMVVGASRVETIRERMGKFPPERVMVIVGDRPRVHRMAIESGVRCLVLTGGFGLDENLVASAEKQGTRVITCDHDTATTTQLIRCARRVSAVLTEDFLSFGANSLVGDIVPLVQSSSQMLFPVVDDDDGTLVGVFSKSDLVDPPRTRLVLVDHNEFSQAVSGTDEAEVLEVVDHHRLSGNLRSKEPIRFVNEPVGSTSTIVGGFFRQAGLEPESGVAKCLVAGIVADTLKLTSPTTTERDGEMLAWLAELAGVEVDEFATAFFAAGSMLRSCAPAEAIGADRKEFEENGWKISISQIEELGLDEFWKQEDALEEALADLCRERGVDFACVMVTDITLHNSLLLTTGSELICDEVEYPELRRNLYEMPGVVSRKKQLFPYLGRILGRLVKTG